MVVSFDNPTYRELAESVSKDENGLEEAEAEEPISDEGSEIKGNLRTRQVVQKTADRHTPPKFPEWSEVRKRGLSPSWCSPFAYGDESPKQEPNGFVSGFDSRRSPADEFTRKSDLSGYPTYQELTQRYCLNGVSMGSYAVGLVNWFLILRQESGSTSLRHFISLRMPFAFG